jgi:hypothetical protein
MYCLPFLSLRHVGYLKMNCTFFLAHQLLLFNDQTQKSLDAHQLAIYLGIDFLRLKV